MITVIPKVSYWTSRGADSDDNWDRGDTDGTFEGLSVQYVTDKDQAFYGMNDSTFNDKPFQPGDVVHVVYGVYSTGDTFGHDGGQVDIFDVFAKDDYPLAEELVLALEGTKDFSVTVQDKMYYVPWNGYFESLNYVSVSSEIVQRQCG